MRFPYQHCQFQDEYEMMMDSQKPLQLPEAQAAHDQQRLRHHAAQLPMNKEVQMLAYQRLPHRTRAAAGMLHAAFKGLQVCLDSRFWMFKRVCLGAWLFPCSGSRHFNKQQMCKQHEVRCNYC